VENKEEPLRGVNVMQEHQIDISQYNVRTDLAVEAHRMAVGKKSGNQLLGVRVEENEQDGIHTSWIWIDNDKGAEQMGKAPGTYLTLEVPKLRSRDSILQKRVAEQFAKEFTRFLQDVGIKEKDKVLLVGLGNWNVTADALGPLVIKQSVVTRHLFTLAPDQVAEGYRSVAGISPGVLGITGIETSEIVQGVVEKIQPDVVIAFDALASRALSRVNTTIQVADSGISPGAGVGNKRKALNKETLGIPVIAIGVPTVVDAVTIAYDTIDYLLAYLSREMSGVESHPLDPLNRPNLKELEQQEVSTEMKTKMLGLVGALESDEKRQLIHEILAPLGQNLIVTPKEVDDFISDMAKLIATGLNCALHKAVTMENVVTHLH
jgi:spore protease